MLKLRKPIKQQTMKNKTLFIIFFVLLGIYGASQMFSGKKQRSFKTELIQVDTSLVTSLNLYPKAEKGGEIILKREQSGWIASKDNINTKAVKNVVDALLKELTLIKTTRVAAKKPEKWPEYEVEENKGTRVKVYQGDQLLEDFMVGRINFKQRPQQPGMPQTGGQQGISATTFVRLNGEDEVYAVEGFLGMTFNRDFSAFRNKQVLKMSPEQQITAFNFESETPANFNKSSGKWMLNDSKTPLDTLKINNYLNTLRNISGDEFADNFDDTRKNDLLVNKLTLGGNNMLQAIEILAYYDSTQVKPFIIHSNYNPDAYFASDSTGIYAKIFQSIDSFKMFK